MKAVIQRVLNASVTVEGNIISSIGKGYLILLGVMRDDTEKDILTLASKTSRLRIFSDEDGKMNQSIIDVDGEILVVSQFTLCTDAKSGNRPGFTSAALPEKAETYYNLYIEKLKENGVKHVLSGKFRADMKVELVNDGPVTIIFDTNDWRKGD
ncbi:MAG: D-aminoacyl-tRNA deacylase [Bacillota bacterium]|nr:D-aminoacyl-tRNA deacylase [Bacillota bacterium]